MKLNAIHLKFQNNDVVDDNVIDVDVVVNCLSCRVRHAPRTRVPAVNGAGDAETSTASPATPRRLCATNAAASIQRSLAADITGGSNSSSSSSN